MRRKRQAPAKSWGNRADGSPPNRPHPRYGQLAKPRRTLSEKGGLPIREHPKARLREMMIEGKSMPKTASLHNNKRNAIG
jgi:hypothetical protein